MTVKSDILDLGVRYGIEEPHTRHVARKALDLFDGFSPLPGLRKNDRRLLFAAACLHDIAYASAPENHVEEGGRILAANPVNGFSQKEWQSVIGIVLLHKRDWRAMLDHESFPQVGEKALERIKKLAAVLRIADGLDHGHIQDARILYCRGGRKVDKIGVECGWYEGNIPWAEGKADLWEAVFKRSVRIEGKVKPHRKIFKGVVQKKDSAISASRRLLYAQWCVMRDNVPGMLQGTDLDCLHDYRVALRRFRAALRMFKPLLNETNAAELDQQLAELSDRLSPVRDAHVALICYRKWMDDADPYPETRTSLEQKVWDANRTLREFIESDFCLQVVQVASSFLRVTLPALERNRPEPLFAAFAQERLDALTGKLRGLDVSNLRNADPSDMHKVRKLCRRGRYYAEFAAPATGNKVQQTAALLKTLAGALGDVRDAQLLQQWVTDQVQTDLIEQKENKAWERFERGWNKYARS